MTRTIRVAMIIQAYYPLIGGAEMQLASLAPLLQARGVDVQVITRRRPGLAPFEIIRGVPVHRVPAPGPKPVASVLSTVSALALLRRLRPDVIHAYDMFSPTSTAIAAKRLYNTPIVVKVLRGGSGGDVLRLKRKAFGMTRIATFRQHVDAFVAISREIDSELQEIGIPPERRLFIPNGVDAERFAPLSPADKRALRASLNLPEGPVVIFIGRLDPEKRVNHLITSWPAVRAAHPNATLLLIGAGSQGAKLREMAGEGVTFLGLLDDVAPYLKASDLFVLPSATEGLSNALLEAMVSSLPVVATAVGGATDLITDRENGWLIPPDDVPALQTAVLTLLGDAERRAGLGRQARERIARDYALPNVAGRLYDLYDRLATTPQPARQPVSTDREKAL